MIFVPTRLFDCMSFSRAVFILASLQRCSGVFILDGQPPDAQNPPNPRMVWLQMGRGGSRLVGGAGGCSGKSWLSGGASPSRLWWMEPSSKRRDAAKAIEPRERAKPTIAKWRMWLPHVEAMEALCVHGLWPTGGERWQLHCSTWRPLRRQNNQATPLARKKLRIGPFFGSTGCSPECALSAAGFTGAEIRWCQPPMSPFPIKEVHLQWHPYTPNQRDIEVCHPGVSCHPCPCFPTDSGGRSFQKPSSNSQQPWSCTRSTVVAEGVQSATAPTDSGSERNWQAKATKQKHPENMGWAVAIWKRDGGEGAARTRACWRPEDWSRGLGKRFLGSSGWPSAASLPKNLVQGRRHGKSLVHEQMRVVAMLVGPNRIAGGARSGCWSWVNRVSQTYDVCWWMTAGEPAQEAQKAGAASAVADVKPRPPWRWPGLWRGGWTLGGGFGSMQQLLCHVAKRAWQWCVGAHAEKVCAAGDGAIDQEQPRGLHVGSF